MVRRWELMIAVILMLALALPIFAQDKEASKAPERPWTFYKLTMTVREVDGAKIINSRSYDFTQRSGAWGMLRVGSKLPVSFGKESTQFQYLDVGLKLDASVQEHDSDVAFDWRLDLSSAATEPTPGGPVIRNVTSNGQTLLTIGKPALLTSVDDLNSTHKFVFEVTATKLK